MLQLQALKLAAACCCLEPVAVWCLPRAHQSDFQRASRSPAEGDSYLQEAFACALRGRPTTRGPAMDAVDGGPNAGAALHTSCSQAHHGWTVASSVCCDARELKHPVVFVQGSTRTVTACTQTWPNTLFGALPALS